MPNEEKMKILFIIVLFYLVVFNNDVFPLDISDEKHIVASISKRLPSIKTAKTNILQPKRLYFTYLFCLDAGFPNDYTAFNKEITCYKGMKLFFENKSIRDLVKDYLTLLPRIYDEGKDYLENVEIQYGKDSIALAKYDFLNALLKAYVRRNPNYVFVVVYNLSNEGSDMLKLHSMMESLDVINSVLYENVPIQSGRLFEFFPESKLSISKMKENNCFKMYRVFQLYFVPKNYVKDVLKEAEYQLKQKNSH